MRNVYKSLILVFISIFTLNVQAIEVGGIISEDTTWSITNEPYVITTLIQIASGKTLTINPGVTVKNGEIRVFGNLQARGTSLNKIVFNNVSIKPYFDGDWTAVKNHYIAISHSNIIGGSIYAATGNVICGTLLLEDSVVDGVKDGIYLWYPTSNASIQRNIFKNIDSEYNDDSFIYALLSDNSGHIQKNITLRIYDNYFDSSVDLPIIAYTQENASIWIFGNTFPRSQRPLLKLRSDSNGNVYAYQNYWGTTIEREISSMIYDRYDDLSIQYEIKYNNYLSEPSPFAPDPPAITSHPSSLTVNSGQSATFSVTASGRNVTYQWMNNGLPVSGATSPVYTINSAQPNNGGQISVLVSNWDGTATSNAATLTVNTPPPPPNITSNLSTVTLRLGKLMSRYTVTTNFGAKSFAAKGLPAGLQLNATTGVVSGKPTKKGTYTVTFTAAKKQGSKVIQSKTAKKVFKVN
jgi:hypothetical protein